MIALDPITELEGELIRKFEMRSGDDLDYSSDTLRIKGSNLAGAVARHPMHHLGGFFAKPRPFRPATSSPPTRAPA